MKGKLSVLVTISVAALILAVIIVASTNPLSARRAFADPIPPSGVIVIPAVFCFRITDIRMDPIDTDRFTFEFEVLNWTNSSADGMKVALAAPNAGSVSIIGAGIDSNGRPLGTLDIDPIPGNLDPPNDWSVVSQSSSNVRWNGGTAVPSRDLLGAASTAAANALIPGFPGTTTIDGFGSVSPAEAIDDGSNVLDGFTLTVDNLFAGSGFQLNWFLTSGGTEIGTTAGGNGYGFGVMNIARVDGAPFPAPIYPGDGNTGFTQDDRHFVDNVYIMFPDYEFAAEFGAAFTAGPVVGGVAELPEVASTPLEAPDSSGSNTGLIAGIVAAIAAGTVALGGAAWYARRRWG